MNFSKLSVLIVEDVAPMRQLLADIISTLGVGTIYTASNGEEGYALYASRKPDIIITDWHMPKVDGLQFVERVRKDPKSPKRTLPIIMISGLNAPARVIRARDFGITEYLVKPFKVQDVARRISHAINQPRDFILTPYFVGPDRRRRKDDSFEGKARREKDTDKKIKAQKKLQLKVGRGQIDPTLVTKSEKVLEETEVDFTPIARVFLNEFRHAIGMAEDSSAPCKRIKEEITFAVMQLKANARIFKYDLIGELSNTTLEFLEGTAEIDDLIIEILNAQYTTLSHLVNTNAKGDGGKAGKDLNAELKEAYKRYNNAKSIRLQNALLTEMQNRSLSD